MSVTYRCDVCHTMTPSRYNGRFHLLPAAWYEGRSVSKFQMKSDFEFQVCSMECLNEADPEKNIFWRRGTPERWVEFQEADAAALNGVD